MRYLLILSLAGMLAACSQHNEPALAAAVTPEQAAAAAAVKLPGGIKFDVPSQLRADTTYQTKKGATRRKVTYELLEVTPEQARSIVVAKMAEAGFAVGQAKPNKRKEGQYSIAFKNKKKARVNVIFYPKLAKKPANPDAKSMIAFDWQTKKAPKPAETLAQ